MKLSIAFLATLLIHTQAGVVVLNFIGDCTYAALEAAADDAGVTDLNSRLSSTDDEDDAAEQAEILCQDARDANSDPHPRRGGACKYICKHLIVCNMIRVLRHWIAHDSLCL